MGSDSDYDDVVPQTLAAGDGGGNRPTARIGGANPEGSDPNHDLELQFGVNYVNLCETPVDASGVSLLPMTLMDQRKCVSFGFEGLRVLVAMVNPNDIRTHDEIKALLPGRRIKPMVCREEEFLEFMSRAKQFPKDLIVGDEFHKP